MRTDRLNYLLAAALAITAFQLPRAAHSQGSAQVAAAVTGRVVHPLTGEPLRGALVRLASASDSVRTDADGRFAIAATGAEALTIGLDGFEFVRLPITADLPGAFNVQATLLPVQLTPALMVQADTVRAEAMPLNIFRIAADSLQLNFGGMNAIIPASRDAIRSIEVVRGRAAYDRYGASARGGAVLVNFRYGTVPSVIR